MLFTLDLEDLCSVLRPDREGGAPEPRALGGPAEGEPSSTLQQLWPKLCITENRAETSVQQGEVKKELSVCRELLTSCQYQHGFVPIQNRIGEIRSCSALFH